MDNHPESDQSKDTKDPLPGNHGDEDTSLALASLSKMGEKTGGLVSESPDNGIEDDRQLREYCCELGREILVQHSREMFIDFDVEGDGPAGLGSVLAIGAVAPTGETFYVEIQRQTRSSLPGPREFCDKLGLTDEYLIDHGVPAIEAAVRFRKWVNDLKHKYRKPAVATAFNAGYDWAHIDLLFASAATLYPDRFPVEHQGSSQPRHNPFGIAPFDTKSLALAVPGVSKADEDGCVWSWNNTSKSKLPVTINPEEEFTHNALDDAIYQQKQHFAMIGLLNIDKYPEIEEGVKVRLSLGRTPEPSGLTD